MVYLWFDTGCPEAGNHHDEIEDFKRRIDPHLDFRSMTHQALFNRLAVMSEQEYVDYLRTRYFPAAVVAQSGRWAFPSSSS